MTTATWIPHLVAFALVAVVPLWDRFETRRLKSTTDPRAKVKSYRRTIAVLWILAAGLLISVPRPDLLYPPQADGTTADLLAQRRVLWPVVIGLSIGLTAPVLGALISPRTRLRVTKPLDSLRWLLPVTTEERRWFAGLCISAGICEEIIYRGFLIRYFEALPFGLTVTSSALLAVVVFVLAHTYQGMPGAVHVAGLALVFTMLFFLSGSLWLPIVFHTLFDLRVLMLWRGDSVQVASGYSGAVTERE